jgi:hypothetical protein
MTNICKRCHWGVALDWTGAENMTYNKPLLSNCCAVGADEVVFYVNIVESGVKYHNLNHKISC